MWQTVKNALIRLLGFQTEDSPKLARALPIALLVAMAQVAGESSYLSLFNTRFGVEYLPIMYAIEVLVIPLEVILFVKLAERLPKDRFINLAFQLLVGIVVLNGAALLFIKLSGQPITWYYPVMYILSNIVDRLCLMTMWTLMEEICSTRQAKRVFPLLIGCYTIGSILAGLVVHQTAQGISAEFIYCIWAILLAIAIPFWRGLTKQYLTPITQLSDTPSNTNLTESVKSLFNSRFLRIAVSATTVLYCLLFLMEYELSTIARKFYPDAEQMSAFFGIFLSSYYITGLIFGGLILGRILERFGISRTILGVAIACLVMFGQLSWLAATPMGLASVFIGALVMFLLVYIVNDPITQLFYKIVPPDRRIGVRCVFGGVAFALGKLLCFGVSVWHSSGFISITMLSTLGAFLAVSLFALAYRQQSAYSRELLQSLSTHSLSLDEWNSAFTGTEVMTNRWEPLVDLLTSTNHRQLKIGLELCIKFPSPWMLPLLQPLCQHMDIAIRQRAVTAVSRSSPQLTAQWLLQTAVHDLDPSIRATAIDGLSAYAKDNDQIYSIFQRHLQDESPKVRSRSVVALGGNSAIITNALQQLLSADVQSQIYACQAIQDASLHPFAPQIITLLDSTAPAARMAAMEALGNLDSPVILPAILAKLPKFDLSLSKAASQTLARIINSSSSTLIEQLNTQDPLTWHTIISALVIQHNDIRKDHLAQSCCEHLQNLDYLATFPASLAALQLTASTNLARRRLNEIRELYCDAAWQVLSLYEDARLVDVTRNAFISQNREKIENALELLSEGLGNRNLSATLAHVISVGLDEVNSDASPGNPIALCKDATSWQDSWLRNIALFALSCQEEVCTIEQPILPSQRCNPLQTTMDTILFLSQVPLFATVSLDELALLAETADECTYTEHTYLFHENQLRDTMYVVISGCIEISGKSAGGWESTLSLMKSGQAFGVDSLLTGKPSSITAQVIMGDARLFAFHRDDLLPLIYRHPNIAIGMLSATSAELQKMQRSLVNLG